MEELRRFQESERGTDGDGSRGRQPANRTQEGGDGGGERVAGGSAVSSAKAPPVLPGAPCRRWFKIGTRADFVNSIKPALHLLGMCEAKGLGEHLTLTPDP